MLGRFCRAVYKGVGFLGFTLALWCVCVYLPRVATAADVTQWKIRVESAIVVVGNAGSCPTHVRPPSAPRYLDIWHGHLYP